MWRVRSLALKTVFMTLICRRTHRPADYSMPSQLARISENEMICSSHYRYWSQIRFETHSKTIFLQFLSSMLAHYLKRRAQRYFKLSGALPRAGRRR